jgi:signal transduction histidine kinase
MIGALRRLPILPQTLLLVVFTLIASLVVNFVLISALPMPRLAFYAMSDVAEALADRPLAQRAKRIDPLLQMSMADAPPVADADMVSNAGLSARLAALLGVPVERVRLLYKQDQSNWPFRYRENEAGVPIRLGEAQFYNTVVAAVQREDGQWHVLRSPKRPIITRFQMRTLTAFVLSVLVILPFAFVFARQLTKPIRRFADAAEAVGADYEAPAVPIEGSVELRQAAEALNKMQMRLAETMAERTAMIGAIAHDLRTPLTRIAFRIEAAPEPVRLAVQADIAQMRGMVEASIGYIRQGHDIGERRPIEMMAMAERLVADYVAMSQPVSLAGNRGWVLGNAVALERVLQNIVDNALSYAGSAEVSVGVAGGQVFVSVMDRGPGLLDAQLDEVFKPFNRGEPSRNRSTGGLGLGLAIARLIVVAHGGTLLARNREGGGLIVEARMAASASGKDHRRSIERAAAAQQAVKPAIAE